MLLLGVYRLIYAVKVYDNDISYWLVEDAHSIKEYLDNVNSFYRQCFGTPLRVSINHLNHSEYIIFLDGNIFFVGNR